MNWTSGTELTRYDVVADASDLIDLDDDEDTSGTEEEDDVVTTTDTTEVIDSFTSRPPLRIGVGAAHQLGGWRFAPMSSIRHSACPWRGPVAGIAGRGPAARRARAARGDDGRRIRGAGVTGGMSLGLGPWHLDLDAGSYSTFSPTAPKGMRFAFGTGFIFG